MKHLLLLVLTVFGFVVTQSVAHEKNDILIQTESVRTSPLNKNQPEVDLNLLKEIKVEESNFILWKDKPNLLKSFAMCVKLQNLKVPEFSKKRRYQRLKHKFYNLNDKLPMNVHCFTDKQLNIRSNLDSLLGVTI